MVAASNNFMARPTNTTLRTSQQAVLNRHGYSYDAAHQRTNQTLAEGNSWDYERASDVTASE